MWASGSTIASPTGPDLHMQSLMEAALGQSNMWSPLCIVQEIFIKKAFHQWTGAIGAVLSGISVPLK